MMEEYSSDVSVIDVYEIASAIGKEFEKIIDVCGTEVVTNLMPRVIKALEHLESLAIKNERENVVLEDLKMRIMKLENDKHARAEDRSKFEKELEQIEEDWHKESNRLLTVVAKLQEENKRLSLIVSNTSNFEEDASVSSEIDMNVVYQLQHQADQLRENVKLQNIELNAKDNEIDNLENQIKHVKSTLLEFKRKQKLQTSQIHGFIDERAKLLIEMQDQRREILLLHQRLGLVQKENEDLVRCNIDVPDLRNKVLYDVDDPDRPRFTIAELKEILHERNELKAKLNELQDELSLYRPDDSIDTQGEDDHFESEYIKQRGGHSDVYLALRFPDHTISKCESLQQSIPSFFPKNVSNVINIKSEIATEYIDEDDLPVQGPLPLEPDDAPWKRSESGIRKLFRKLFNEHSVGSVKKVSMPISSAKTSSSSSPTTSAISNI